MSKPLVAVGMSGGVDSAVSAYLLKEQGYEVIGLFMRNWGDDEECPAKEDLDDVARVCNLLNIPFYPVNFTEEYWENVFSTFLEELKAGLTPNPDILCNREIKFKHLYAKARSLGASFLATGHYARTDGTRLQKGLDPGKDQSYFLYTLKEELLPHILFPVGELPKSEVRKIASAISLPVATKKDSTGICFIGKRDFRPFVQRYLPYSEGPLETIEGKLVGKHEGAAFYTIGQRKGLGIGGPGDAWFVVGKEMERNAVIVAQGEEHPALFASSLTANEISWVGPPPKVFPYRCTAKIRYRQSDQSCTISLLEEDRLLVTFDQPQRAITPRQSIVFYDGDVCLGGAMIEPR